MLNVCGLCKSFSSKRGHQTPVRALDEVHLDVADGAFAAVLGASGSGKTTLLRCIAGFEVPDSGTISLAGCELCSPSTPSLRPNLRGVGIVPQESALFPHLTTAQNIAFGLHGRTRSAQRARVATLLELVGMEGLGDRRPHELSGGQQQRVALARALAPEPDLILLDEPFSALDAKLRVELRAEVRSLLHQLGATAILVTHDQAEAMTMADHLIVLRAGRVVTAGAPRDVYDDPADLELAQFLGTTSVLPGQASRDGAALTVTCALGRLAARPRPDLIGACRVLVRPEDLEVTPATPGTAQSDATAVVSGMSFFGAEALLHVTLEATRDPLAVRVPGHARHEDGDLVTLRMTRPVCCYPPGGHADQPSPLPTQPSAATSADPPTTVTMP